MLEYILLNDCRNIYYDNYENILDNNHSHNHNDDNDDNDDNDNDDNKYFIKIKNLIKLLIKL